MILPLLLAALTFAALLPVLRPLLRGGTAGPGREAYDQAVYRDQLRELERDIERGLLTEAEAVSARLEIQRRLLGTVPDPAPVSDIGRKPLPSTLSSGASHAYAPANVRTCSPINFALPSVSARRYSGDLVTPTSGK